MLRQISESLKGLSLERPFSKIAAVTDFQTGSTFKSSSNTPGTSSVRGFKDISTTRTDSSFSNDRTLASTRRNHDTQPLHYKAKKRYKPMQAAELSSDVKKHKRMSTLKDRRILRPDRTSTAIRTRRSVSSTKLF